MGEIVGGIIVMAIFIAFILWKGKEKGRARDRYRRSMEDQYWADKDSESSSTFSFGSGGSGGGGGDDDGGGGDGGGGD